MSMKSEFMCYLCAPLQMPRVRRSRSRSSSVRKNRATPKYSGYKRMGGRVGGA